MTRRISICSYRKPDTLYSPLDLVVCEGETGVDYLCELARSLRIHVHICKGDGTDPKSIVNTAKRKSKEDGVKYDKDGVQIFNATIHFIDMACKRASSLVSTNMKTLKKILLRIFTYSSKDFRFLKRNKTILDNRGNYNEN